MGGCSHGCVHVCIECVCCSIQVQSVSVENLFVIILLKMALLCGQGEESVMP